MQRPGGDGSDRSHGKARLNTPAAGIGRRAVLTVNDAVRTSHMLAAAPGLPYIPGVSLVWFGLLSKLTIERRAR